MKNILQAALLNKGMLAMEGIALEEDVQDGKLFAEHEHEYYVELANIEDLKGADSMDMQEQWTIKIPKTDKNNGKGSLRIRKIQEGDVNGGAEQTSNAPIQYVMTTKADLGPGNRLEVPVASSEDNFKLFKLLAEGGMIKHRYHFPVEDGLVFEVDMFINPEGGYYPVCKIDLEVPSKSIAVPPFPFETKSVIEGGSRSKEDQEKIREYYDKYFITIGGQKKRKENDPGDHEYRGDYHSDAAAVKA